MASKKDILEIKSSIQQINDSIGEIRDSVIRALLDENKLLKLRVRKLEVDLAEHSQYIRRNNICISGIPSTVKDDALESSAIDLLNEIDVHVMPKEIEAVHRIGKRKDTTIVHYLSRKDTTIVHYLSRKDSIKAIKNRKKLGSVNFKNLGYKDGTKVYIQENFCPLKKLHSCCLTFIS